MKNANMQEACNFILNKLVDANGGKQKLDEMKDRTNRREMSALPHLYPPIIYMRGVACK